MHKMQSITSILCLTCSIRGVKFYKFIIYMHAPRVRETTSLACVRSFVRSTRRQMTAENRNLNELIESVWHNINGGNYNDDEKKQAKKEKEREKMEIFAWQGNVSKLLTKHVVEICQKIHFSLFFLAGWLVAHFAFAAFAKERKN